MADITLKAYLSHLDDLLGRRSYEEAEAHAKHILGKFPKNMPTLRRLSQAQLEAGHFAEAEKTYALILSMEPRSVEAYVGLSWVARQRGNGDQAIALLERAFEQDTNNQETVQLLRDAHRTFNDRSNAKLPQTQYIAARLQWRSGLAQQAISTLNAALDADPARADLRLLKAQILMQMGDGMQAARAATDVVKQLPDCIEANRMLAEFWKAQGRASDAQRFVSRVEAAEPFLAFEIATGAPPPDDALMLSLLDYRNANASEALSETSTPDWLGELDRADLGRPEPTERSTPRVEADGGDSLDWLAAAEQVPEERTVDTNWLSRAVDAAQMPDDLSWMTEAAAADTAGDANDADDADFADFAASLSFEEEAPAPAQDMEWIDGEASDEGETLPSISTKMAEEEVTSQKNLDELSALSADQRGAQSSPEGDAADAAAQSEEDWLNTLASAASDPTNPERQDFDEFLHNFTNFGDLSPERASQSSGTGLTGLLSSLTTPDEQPSPELADIDPDDPLAWMRAGVNDDASPVEYQEDDLPDLDALLGGEMTGEQPDAVSEVSSAAEKPVDTSIPADDDDDGKYAWMQGTDIELVPERDVESLWDDPLGVQDVGTLDPSDVDPLAWIGDAGVEVEEDGAAEPDPLAWAKESGIDLLDEVGAANFSPTANLPGDGQEDGTQAEEQSLFDEPEADQPPAANKTGLLAFLQDGGTFQQEGERPMSDKDLPNWLSDPENEDDSPKAEPADLNEFDWMAVAPADSDGEIDWDAAPETQGAVDEDAPDWLASLENPVDSAEAAALSAKDDPGVADLWDDAADDAASADMPEWMAALRDEPAADEQQPDAAAEWLFTDAKPASDEALGAQDDMLVSASAEQDAAIDAPATDPSATADTGAQAADSAEMPDVPEAAEIADVGAELGLDWLSAVGTADVAGDAPAADASDETNLDWLKDAAPAEASDSAEQGSDMDWLSMAADEEKAPDLSSEAAAHDSFDWLAEAAAAGGDDDAERAVSPEFMGEASEDDSSFEDFDFGSLEPATGEQSEGALEPADADFLAGLDTPESDSADAEQPAFELSFIEEDTPTEDVATVELEGDPLPDWLMENKPDSALRMDIDVPEEQLDVAGGLAGEILDDADLLEAEPPAQESLTAAAVNSPDWLNAMVPGLEVEMDALDEEADAASEGEFVNGSRGDFGWLSDIVDEELAPPAVAAPARRASRFPFAEPPVWLTLLREETQGAAPLMDMDADDDSLPDWLKFDDAEAN